jgi:hypothetical protein
MLAMKMSSEYIFKINGGAGFINADPYSSWLEVDYQ